MGMVLVELYLGKHTHHTLGIRSTTHAHLTREAANLPLHSSFPVNILMEFPAIYTRKARK
jgi:hypothetical protein